MFSISTKKLYFSSFSLNVFRFKVEVDIMIWLAKISKCHFLNNSETNWNWNIKINHMVVFDKRQFLNLFGDFKRD